MTKNLRPDNVVSLSNDPVFFSKHQLRVGTMLRYFGRRNPGSLWFVTRIKLTGRSYIPTWAASFPRTFGDLIELTCHATGERRHLTFAYLSYSAIWRIED